MNDFLKARFAALGIAAVLLLAIASCKDEEPVAPDAVVSFDYDATTDVIGQAPLNVQFTNRSENAQSYLWDFGDGTTSEEAEPLHVYETGGIYTVVLTVTNEDDVAFTEEAEIELASPLVGTWVLDSAAASTIDTVATLGAIEVGASQSGAACPATGVDGSNWEGWTGSGWTHIYTDAEPYGYSTFWSDVIFAGNYFGRKDFFENEFTFNVDGGYEVDLKGDLRLPDFVVAAEADYDEAEDWQNADGVSLNAWKSNSEDYTYQVTESTVFSKHGSLTLNGEGAFLGVFFAGVTGADTHKSPQPAYHFTIASVSDSQLIVAGFTSGLLCASDLMVLKFKKVE